MELKVRKARKEDKEQMLQLYNSFTKGYVGSASRTLKSFARMFRRKDAVNYVALDSRNRIVGYVHAVLEKRNRTGEFRDIVVDPKYSFEQVASLLAERVNAAFAEKKAAAIVAGSLRNPAYERIFPKLGFMESESNGVFMYAILDAQKLLNELRPVFTHRLCEAESWNGLAQIQCDEDSIFLEKAGEGVQQVVWTNQPIDFKVKLSRSILTKLMFGVADPVKCYKDGQLAVESTVDKTQTLKLLERLFAKSQFLIADFW